MAGLEEKISTYWPIAVAAVVVVMWISALRSDVDANASDITNLKESSKDDHIALIRIDKRLLRIACKLNVECEGDK